MDDSAVDFSEEEEYGFGFSQLLNGVKALPESVSFLTERDRAEVIDAMEVSLVRLKRGITEREAECVVVMRRSDLKSAR